MPVHNSCVLRSFCEYVLFWSRQGSIPLCQVDLSYFMHVRYVCMFSIMYKCIMYNVLVQTLSHIINPFTAYPAVAFPMRKYIFQKKGISFFFWELFNIIKFSFFRCMLS